MRNLLVLFLLLIGVIPSVRGEASLIVRDSLINFGYLPTKSTATRSTIFYSVGTDTLVINDINTTCDCLKLVLDRRRIAPGDSLKVEVIYDSELNVGIKDRYPYIYTNARKEPYRIAVKTITAADMYSIKPITVKPFRVLASDPKEHYNLRFRFEVINTGTAPVPLTLLYNDSEFFAVRLPDEVPAGATAAGEIVLTPEGVRQEFAKSFTFEYVDNSGQKVSHTVPVLRRIYKK